MRTLTGKIVSVIAGTFVLAIFFGAQLSAQQPDYPRIFGDDWKKAGAWVDENRSWMEPLLKKNNISWSLAVAVVFPELVRYSALRDKMEITLLKALYINLGDDYANFSIGRFQMKPSFAHMVREQAASVLPRRSGIRFSLSGDYPNIRDYRRSIVEELEDPEASFRYLIAFIKICGKNFRTGRMEEPERLAFIATAYNSGFGLSVSEIEAMERKKFFSTSLFKTENYSYSDISLYWYRTHPEPAAGSNKR